MILKIGYEHWHVECQCSNYLELRKCARAALLSYAKNHQIPLSPMMVAVFDGREWWMMPPDRYSAATRGEVKIVWPVDKNDFEKIWDEALLSFEFGKNLQSIIGFVSNDTVDEKRKKFKIVGRAT